MEGADFLREKKVAYTWDLKKKKKDTNKLIYKTETDSQTEKTNLGLLKRKGRDKLGIWV